MINLITIARFAKKKKGYDLIPDVCNIIHNKIDFKWTIIGRGTTEILKFDYVKNNKEKFNIVDEIKNNTDLYFPSKQLIEILKKNDLYVNLSRIESFGVTIIEAMASGLPVVSFDTKGVNELIINKKNGFLIPENNFIKFTNEIINFDKNKNYLDQKSFNNDYLKKFDLENEVNNIIKIYKQVHYS